MSVNCVITSLTDAQLQFLFAHPEHADGYLRAVPPRPRSWIWKLLHRQVVLPPEIADLSNRHVVDLGKSWGAIHFVLTGVSPDELTIQARMPAGTLLAGDEIGDDDLGFGPPLGVPAAGAAAFAELLERVTPAAFAARARAVDAETLTESGAPISDEHDEEGLRLFVDDYGSLRSFLSDIAAKRLALIVQFV
jgi:uncharacterized protein DUF1877